MQKREARSGSRGAVSRASRGFTLIELMITLVIMVVVISIGVPSFNDFIASQRVRTTASDLMADMAFARAEAIKESRQAIMERVAGGTGTWKDGWRICVDLNADGSCDADEVRKSATPVPGDPATTVVCATDSGLLASIAFRPDGRVVGPPAAANAGLKIQIDVGADSSATNDRIRMIFLGVSGRASVEVQDNRSDSPACATI
jgi:prepilin-type N-terminal cleavage/methylation domain-containing protein